MSTRFEDEDAIEENTHEACHTDEAVPKDTFDPLDELVQIRLERKPMAQIRQMSVGYVDTEPEELGAAPMKGQNRHAWKKIQQVTFTNWINDRINGKGSSKVKDIQKDFQNGLHLIYLLENLSKKKIPKVVKDPKISAQEYANLGLAFKFMQEEKVKLVGIGSCHNNYSCMIMN